MDWLTEESREERSIEDYLFGGYPIDSTFDKDQQFAKPIEDDDLFGGPGDDNPTKHDTSTDEQLANPAASPRDLLPAKKCPDLMTGDGLLPVNLHIENESHNHIDDIFIDDYSLSPSPRLKADPSNCLQNAEKVSPKTYTTNQPAPPTPAQLRLKHMKESFLQQAKAMNLPRPKKIASDCDDSDAIEMVIEQENLESDSSSKFIFNRMMNRTKKLAKSPEEIKKSWTLHKDALRKRICAQKRKIWDSLHAPTDLYDEEERLSSEDEDVEHGSSDDENPFEIDKDRADSSENSRSQSGESETDVLNDDDVNDIHIGGDQQVEDDQEQDIESKISEGVISNAKDIEVMITESESITESEGEHKRNDFIDDEASVQDSRADESSNNSDDGQSNEDHSEQDSADSDKRVTPAKKIKWSKVFLEDDDSM